MGSACTCGGDLPIVLPAPDAPKDTDDNPYRDVERSRDLAKRAKDAAEAGDEPLATFLLELAREARLLAELQGKWEYGS